MFSINSRYTISRLYFQSQVIFRSYHIQTNGLSYNLLYDEWYKKVPHYKEHERTRSLVVVAKYVEQMV